MAIAEECERGAQPTQKRSETPTETLPDSGFSELSSQMDPEFDECSFPSPFLNPGSVPLPENQDQNEAIDIEFDELDEQFETASVASSAFSFLPHAPRPETINIPLREKRPRVDARKIKSQIKNCLQKV